jgi:hypothetical protein
LTVKCFPISETLEDFKKMCGSALKKTLQGSQHPGRGAAKAVI